MCRARAFGADSARAAPLAGPRGLIPGCARRVRVASRGRAAVTSRVRRDDQPEATTRLPATTDSRAAGSRLRRRRCRARLHAQVPDPARGSTHKHGRLSLSEIRRAGRDRPRSALGRRPRRARAKGAIAEAWSTPRAPTRTRRRADCGFLPEERSNIRLGVMVKAVGGTVRGRRSSHDSHNHHQRSPGDCRAHRGYEPARVGGPCLVAP